MGDWEPAKMLLGAGDSILSSRFDFLLRFDPESLLSSSRDLLDPAREDPFVSGTVEN